MALHRFMQQRGRIALGIDTYSYYAKFGTLFNRKFRFRQLDRTDEQRTHVGATRVEHSNQNRITPVPIQSGNFSELVFDGNLQVIDGVRW
jgi:hypothetical protein